MNDYNNDNDSSQDTPYNFSLFYYMSLNKMLDEKDNAYMNNEIKVWYKYIDRIFKRIVFKLKPLEEKEIKDLLLLARNKLEKNDLSAKDQLHECDILLIKMMDKYKMIFPRIGIGGIDGLAKKLGIKGVDKNAIGNDK